MSDVPLVKPFHFWCQKVLPLVYDDSLSYYEVLCKIGAKLNEVIKTTNDLNQIIQELQKYVDDTFVTKYDLKFNRFLDEKGHFTGYLYEYPVKCVLESIADNISLAKTLIDDVNHRQSIGTIYDGGTFTETDPPTLEVDGGEFYSTKVLINYDQNCIRPDYIVTN